MKNNKPQVNTVKHGLVPRLRFPEFKDVGEWEVKQLRDICEVNPSGGSIPDRFIYIDLESVVSGTLLSKKEISKEVAPSRAQRILKSGDVIYQMVRPYQRNNLLCCSKDDNNYVASTGYAQLRAYDSSKFIYHYMHSDQFVYRVLAKCTGSSYPAINSHDLSNIFVVVPKPPEQQKIAECLSSLDDLITAETEKLNTFKEHKKGLMQQLFPSEGKTVPKLRFPKFKSVEEWKSMYLYSISTVLRGGSPRPINEYLTSEPEGLNWLKIGDVDKESKYIVRTKERVLKTALRNTREVFPGDLIMSNSMSFGRPYILNIKTCIHDGWIAITNIVDRVYIDYLYYSLLSDLSQVYFDNTAAGGGIKNLNADIVKLLKIMLPKDKAEQRIIADCLASIDEVIAIQTEKIEQLKTHKNGLMRQLFPQEACK